ncbi:hypothetical protein SANTM175S_08019 [Streptomyces antimycoticus]
MPWPGVTSIEATMSATVPWSLSRSHWTACSLSAPSGSCRPMRPAKIRSVASPRIFGPATASATLHVPSASTSSAIPRSGRSRASSRRPEPRKSRDRSVGCPPMKRPGPAAGAGPLRGAEGAAHAVSLTFAPLRQQPM